MARARSAFSNISFGICGATRMTRVGLGVTVAADAGVPVEVEEEAEADAEADAEPSSKIEPSIAPSAAARRRPRNRPRTGWEATPAEARSEESTAEWVDSTSDAGGAVEVDMGEEGRNRAENR